MVARGAQIRLNDESGDFDSWSKAIIPITNGYGYMDLAWDRWRHLGRRWQRHPAGEPRRRRQLGERSRRGCSPSNFTRMVFDGEHAFVLGERGNLLRWVGNAV